MKVCQLQIRKINESLPFNIKRMHAAKRHDVSNRQPPTKVLNILDNFCPKSEDLTTTLFLGDLSFMEIL